jgi:hypothetical protein
VTEGTVVVGAVFRELLQCAYQSGVHVSRRNVAPIGCPDQTMALKIGNTILKTLPADLQDRRMWARAIRSYKGAIGDGVFEREEPNDDGSLGLVFDFSPNSIFDHGRPFRHLQDHSQRAKPP